MKLETQHIYVSTIDQDDLKLVAVAVEPLEALQSTRVVSFGAEAPTDDDMRVLHDLLNQSIRRVRTNTGEGE